MKGQWIKTGVLAAAVMGFGLAETASATFTMNTVPIGGAGNTADTTGHGSVAYDYSMGTYEVTTGQYVDFLNAVARTSDPYGVYSGGTGVYGSNITRTGTGTTGDPYVYSVASDWANRPVDNVSWGSAARFANWMSNGQPTGAQDASTTENGSYTLNGKTSQADLLAVTRNANATWVLPTQDEWYKAAYYDSTNSVYFSYPTGDNSAQADQPAYDTGHTMALYGAHGYPDPTYYRTEVGSYTLSGSPSGTFDQGGNVWEWTQTSGLDTNSNEKIIALGGAFNGDASNALSTNSRLSNLNGQYDFGFRVAMVPEPASMALLALAFPMLLSRRRV